ncbi:hypothetical protein BY458DRAFT_493893 [Sporodiniella umbellata]|nr:hypothetical protein BY458DRAFT_493893 [Sporodiniella umbellata]
MTFSWLLSKAIANSKMNLCFDSLSVAISISMIEFGEGCTSRKCYIEKLRLTPVSRIYLNLLLSNFKSTETGLLLSSLYMMHTVASVLMNQFRTEQLNIALIHQN